MVYGYVHMINDIINTFETKFNKFADTTDAFTSRFIRDNDSAVGTLCFNDFNVEFEYCLECGGMVEKSGLNIILDFSKRLDIPLRCMMYDIVGFIDKNNFSCWFYCFIENSDRMELCFEKLSRDFQKIFPAMRKFISSDSSMKKVEEVVRKNIKATVGIDIVSEWQTEFTDDDDINLDDAYNYLFNLYFGFEQCAFSSHEYRDFLEGDWKKALRCYEKKKNRLVYEDAIACYIKSGVKPEPVLTEEYECLKDGLKESSGASGFWPFMGAWGMMIVPFLAVCIGIYYAIGCIVYSSAIYATSLEFYNVLYCLIPALICSMVAGYFMREKIYRKFFRKKFRKMMDYDAIFNTEKSTKRVRVLLYLIYIIALVLVFLCVNNGIAFSNNGIRDKSGFFTIVGTYHSYEDVTDILCTKSEAGKEYKIYYDDGTTTDVSRYAATQQIEEKIIPILESGNVKITTVNSTDKIQE